MAPLLADGEAPRLAAVRTLYERGQYVSAWNALRAQGPLEAWTSTAERVLLGRVLMQVGNVRRSRLEFIRAFRQAPTDPEACYYHAMTVLQRQGPLLALRFMERIGELEHASAEQRADWFLTRANALGALRDFEAAERWQERAEALAPQHPWLWVQRSHLRALADSYDAAVEAARTSLSLRPWFRPGIQQLAHVLMLRGRDEEALALLEEGCQRIQSAALFTQLGALQGELGRFDASLRSYWRAMELSVWLDRSGFAWFGRVLSRAAYLAGDRARAVELAEWSGEEGEKLRARMRDATSTHRVLLEVPFIRQNHKTCAPATLASISAFWGMPADHVAVAETICYDGTPARSERKWAEDNGWLAREFTVDWDTAVALLDRGIPFTLTTVETASAHLQAVVGYDACRRSLLIRDPSTRYLVEMDADAMLERYAWSGPRGMLLLPRGEAARLEGLALPDAELYDALFRIELALVAHDRAEAGRVHGEMQARDPGHRLTIDASLSLAGYDADRRARLSCIERLLERHPDVPRLQLLKVSWSADLIPGEQRLPILAALASKPQREPQVLFQYAAELSGDARQHDVADRLLRRALRYAPEAADGYLTLARIRWRQGRREEALALHRIAACLSDKEEQYAYEYFRIAHALGRTDEALALLDDRFRRFGHKAAGPCATLVGALESLDRSTDARVVLERGLALLPADGELKLRAVHAYLRSGEVERAAELLEASRGKVHEGSWLRAAAELDVARLDVDSALARWRTVLELDPLAMDAHQRMCQLLTGSDGPERAIEHLAAAVARFTHHVPLHEMYLGWVRDHDARKAEAAARRLLELHPADAWAHRELAVALARQQRLQEAAAEVVVAREIDPKHPNGLTVDALVREFAGEVDAAKGLLQEALRIEPDHPFAIQGLMQLCGSLDERRDALEAVAVALDRSPLVGGDGLLAFLEEAQGVEEGDALVELFRRWSDTKPGLWAAHCGLTRQLRSLRRFDEAAAAARGMVERFPLVPGSWIELAYVHEARGETSGAEAALRRAQQLNPEWGTPSRLLARLLERQGALDRAGEVLERAVRHAANDGELHAALARVWWAAGRYEQALDRMERALRVDPSQMDCWEELAGWAAERGAPERPKAVARALVEARASSPYPCLALAQLLPTAELVERLSLLEEGIRRAPRLGELYDFQATWLAEVGRFEEARRACRPEIFGANPPRELLARAAWVTAQSGDLRGAVAQVKALLDRDRNYLWCVLRLADWTHSLGDAHEAIAAANRLVELEPHVCRSHGYLGDAYCLAGDLERAKAAFEKAISLEPGYRFAVLKLFEMYTSERDWAKAQALLDRVEPHLDPGSVLARRVVLAVGLGDRTGAASAMTRLLVNAADDAEAYRMAEDALGRAGWSSTLREALESATPQNPSPALGRHWGRLLARGTALPAWLELRRLRRIEAMGGRATATYLEALAESGRPLILWLFLRLHGSELRTTAIWGAMTYALATVGAFRLLLRLARGWRSVPGVAPWMLSNVVTAARALGERRLAIEVSELALSLTPDELTSTHRVWLANAHALSGRASEAAALLAAATIAPGRELASFVHRITGALVRGWNAGFAHAARRELDLLWPEAWKARASQVHRQVYLDAVRAVASRERTVAAWWWWFKRWTSISMLSDA